LFSIFSTGRGGEGGEGRGRGRGEGKRNEFSMFLSISTRISFIMIGGRGRGRGRRGQRPKEDGGKQWVPVTKLGRLVNDGKIRTLEEIYLFSLPIKAS
jgi:hypothetical protein